MNKAVFLHKLNERLSVINEDERTDLLNEYAAHIDMKVAEGLSEEEAIAGFGDFDELTADLLAAYHVDPEYDKYEDATISSTLRRIGHFFEDALGTLLDMNRQEAFHVLTRLVIVGIITFCIIVCLAIFENIIESVVYFPANKVTTVLHTGIALFFTIVKLAVVLYAVYFFLNRYVVSVQPTYRRKQGVQQSAEATGADDVYDENIQFVKYKDATSTASATSAYRRPRSEPRDTEPLMKIFYLIIKLFVFFVLLLPMILSFVGTIVATTALIALAILGWPLIGAAMITAGVALLLYVIIAFIWGFTFKSEVAQ